MFLASTITEVWIFFGQNCIATHESNGIDIITALILNDINPLGKKRMDLVLELKASEYFVFHIKSKMKHNFIVGIMWVFIISQYS